MKTGSIKDKVIAAGFPLLLAAGLVLAAALPDRLISETETRKLQQLPELSAESIISGDFFSSLEDYYLDQFPARDTFRAIKAGFRLEIMRQKESNGLYCFENAQYKLLWPLDESAVSNNSARLRKLVDECFGGCAVYYSVIPDKGSFISAGYPCVSTQSVASLEGEALGDAVYLDISGYLGQKSYYATDPHWRQEEIRGVADCLLAAMTGTTPDYSDDTVVLAGDFSGSYYRQLLLGQKSEELRYITNAALEGFTVFDYETGAHIAMYQEEKLSESDAYSFFLGGARALLTIENPNNSAGRELFLVRDSFGSSIAPLLALNYSRVTLVDPRYITANAFNQLITVNPENSDVLFLLSAMILNQQGVFR